MKSATPRSFLHRNRLLSLAAAQFATSWVLAQNVPATTNSAADAAKQEQPVELSPFTVKADSADAYTALNTNSVTRFSAELAKLPVSADVFTETFMEDVAALSIEEMVVDYGTGTGIGGSNPEAAADANRPGDRASNVNIKIRGLDGGQMRVNNFGAGGIDDTFTTERVDVVRGPQSLLSSGVGGGGVVNAVTKQARFNSNLTRFQVRTDDNGSLRGVLDYGIGSKRFALRFSGMKEDQRFSRFFLNTKSEGLYAQVAAQLTKSTVVRFDASKKWSDTVQSSNNTTLVFPSLGSGASQQPADPRNGATLRLLIAQGRVNDIAGGKLHWSNVDTLRTPYYGSDRDNTHYEAKVEQKFGDHGVLELAGMYDISYMDRAETNSFTNLVAPLRGGNPLSEWAVGFRPGNTHESFRRRGYRANYAAEFELLNGRMRNQVLLGAQYEYTYNKRRSDYYFLTDGSGNIVVNQAQITNNAIGRTEMPVQWFPVSSGPLSSTPIPRTAPTIVGQDGRTYALASRTQLGAVPPTPSNPLGARGTGSFWDQYSYNDSYYFAMQSDWFGDRFTTLTGYRVNNVENKRYELGDSKRSTSAPASYNAGANFRLTRTLRPYYGFSSAFNPPDIVQFGPHGDVTQTSKSVGHELGIKFDPKSGFFSGSISVFSVDSQDEQVSIETDLRNDINPPGINGAYSPSQNWINIDRESKGAELMITAKPTRNWRSRLTLAYTDGTVAESQQFGIFYNDEFHTDGRGGVTYADGTPLLVAVDPTQNNNASAPRTQLTVAMMNTPSSGYFAVLDPDSGRITNAAALRLNSTSPTTGAPVGTGRRGLPISAHQLNFNDPNGNGGFITVSQAGEPTAGYAKYSANFTNTYTFDEGWFKGVTLNATAFFRSKDRTYAYTQVFRDASGRVTSSERRMYAKPDYLRFNAMAAYKRKLGRRLEWTTQVNVNNVFNSYDVIVLPNSSSGDPRTAAFTAEPRTWVWTNTFSF